ncbi:MAG: tetratricopeptide repeat protein, partial [Candidatus Omnitrophica bacterium]|nr:tetratricopeptide repeat protein [Candidatus Omnitrophota bacterium]
EPISSKLTKGQLEGQLTRLLEKVPALKDKQQLQALYFEAGDLCMKLEDSTKAVEYYTQVVQMDPESDLARRSRFNMAWNNKRQGRLNEALKEFELLSKIKGQEKLDVLCYYQIADISALKGDYRSAADAYQKIAVEEEATDKNLASFSYFKAGYSYLYDLGEYDKAKELFNKSETVSKGSSFSAKVESEVIPQISTEYFNNGFNLLEEGYLKSAPDYYRRALGCFDKALEISENSQIYAGKSLAYLWLNDPGNTLLFARKAAKLFSKDEFACVNLGYIYIQLGMIEDAIKEYKRFISSNRNSAKAYYNLGYAYIMQNKLEDAVSSFTRAVKIDPQLGKAFNNRGLCFWRLGRYAEAIQSFQQAVTVNPDLADAFYNLGIIYKSMGKYDESFQELSAALKLKPGSIEIKRQLDEVMLFQSARN